MRYHARCLSRESESRSSLGSTTTSRYWRGQRLSMKETFFIFFGSAHTDVPFDLVFEKKPWCGASLANSLQSTLPTTEVSKLPTRPSFQLVTLGAPRSRTSTSVQTTHALSLLVQQDGFEQGVPQVHSAEMITVDSRYVEVARENNARFTLFRHM